MASLLNKVKQFPSSPGVYLMKDAAGHVLYIGKAIDLKKRVLSYFKAGSDQRYQIDFLMERLREIEYITTVSEKEALLLEHTLIQKHKPRYNIDLKDSKSFVRVKLSSYHHFPGIYVTRRTPKDGGTYFGPYTSAASCRETVDLMIRSFKLRTCSDHFFANRSRPCIQYDIGRCSAPCVALIPKEDYKKDIKRTKMFLKGRVKELLSSLKNQMKTASKEMRYEEAAHLRDVIKSIKITLEPQRVVRPEPPEPPSYAALIWNPIAITLTKKLGLASEPHRVECVDISNISGKFAVGVIIAFTDGIPDKNNYRKFKIRTKDEPDDYAMMKEVLTRKFTSTGPVAAGLLRVRLAADARRPLRATRRPHILLIDGGKGQLAIAKKVLSELDIDDVALVAIAKGANRKQDEIYIPGRKNPVAFRNNDPAYLFLRRVRDEAHRFGITYYRKRHRKMLIESALDHIPGIGPTKRKALLVEFGSIAAIKKTPVEKLVQVKGISRKNAQTILKHL